MECEQFLKLEVAAIAVGVTRMQCAMVQRIAALRCLGGAGLWMKRLFDADKAYDRHACCSTCEISD